MKEATGQLTTGYNLVPDSTGNISDEFSINQMVRYKIWSIGAQKQRSVKALNLLMACCKTVADNTDDPQWNTKDKVKKQLKVALNFIDINKTIVDPSGTAHFHYRSFSFKDLAHMESVKVFDISYPILAGKIGLTVDELIDNTKANMRSYK